MTSYPRKGSRVDIEEIRERIKRAISDRVDGLTADSLRDNPDPPCAIVYPDTPLMLDMTFDGSQWPKFCILILVPYVDTDDAQAQLGRYLETTGDSSVKEALEDDSTLEGLIGGLHVNELRSYGVMSMHDGGTRYLSAELIAEVLT